MSENILQTEHMKVLTAWLVHEAQH